MLDQLMLSLNKNESPTLLLSLELLRMMSNVSALVSTKWYLGASLPLYRYS